MEKALRAALLANVGVAAIIGVPEQIAWGRLPQGQDLPYIALNRLDGGYSYTQAGRVATITPLVQIDCWAASYEGAARLAAAVKAAIDTRTAAPWQGVFLIDERADDEAGDGPDAGGATDFDRTSLDVRVTWSPTV